MMVSVCVIWTQNTILSLVSEKNCKHKNHMLLLLRTVDQEIYSSSDEDIFV